MRDNVNRVSRSGAKKFGTERAVEMHVTLEKIGAPIFSRRETAMDRRRRCA